MSKLIQGPVGNYYDKFNIRNPVARRLMTSFWLIFVFLVAFIFLFRNYTEIAIHIQAIPIQRLFLSIILIFIGRLLMVQLARLATDSVGWLPNYRNMLYMMGTSELGKYLPGGVWHFVGRAAYYRGGKLSATDVTRALVYETLWYVLSAALSGSVLLILYAEIFLITKIIGVGFLLLAWLGILWLMQHHYVGKKSSHVIIVFLLQGGIWLVFSLSFIAVLPATIVQANFFLVFAAFPLGWLVGFLTPFAPGGVGTREAALVALLLPILAPEKILIFVAFHRLLWVILELLIGIAVMVWGRDPIS